MQNGYDLEPSDLLHDLPLGCYKLLPVEVWKLNTLSYI